MESCEHEFVMTEYLNQTYGHCVECNCTVIKDENNQWVKP